MISKPVVNGLKGSANAAVGWKLVFGRAEFRRSEEFCSKAAGTVTAMPIKDPKVDCLFFWSDGICIFIARAVSLRLSHCTPENGTTVTVRLDAHFGRALGGGSHHGASLIFVVFGRTVCMPRSPIFMQAGSWARKNRTQAYTEEAGRSRLCLDWNCLNVCLQTKKVSVETLPGHPWRERGGSAETN